MARHPFIENAELIEERLRQQRRHDKLNDGVCLYASEQDEQRDREEARHLRHLAQLDLDEGTYPID